MVFAKDGQVFGETFLATVFVFDLPPTDTPEEFVAMVRADAENSTDLNRFEMKDRTIVYTDERGYPCVRFHSLAVDKRPALVAGPLLTEREALFCRHPVHQNAGFTATYTHRGVDLYANLHREAEAFIQGMQVPTVSQ